MWNYAQFRNWRKWIGLLLLLPLCVIAATGFLWNHERRLGLTTNPVASKMSRDHHTAPHVPATAVAASPLTATPGTWQLQQTAIDAALTEAQDIWGDNTVLERIELKQEPALGLVVKIRAVDDANVRPYEITWSAEWACVLEQKGDPASGTDWAKLVHDLHTGKFLNRSFGFLWSDLSALALIVLSATGVVLYAIPFLKKRAKRARNTERQVGASNRNETHPSWPQDAEAATRPKLERTAEHV